MPRTLGPILEISYDYLIHIVVWNHSLMCPVLIRYKTTKVFVINNLDFGSISTGVGLSILISNLSKKRGFFCRFSFLSIIFSLFLSFTYLIGTYIFFYYFEKNFRHVYLFCAHCFLSTLLHNFDFWHTIIHSLVFSVHKFKNSLIRCRKRSICLQYCGTLFLVSWRSYYSSSISV